MAISIPDPYSVSCADAVEHARRPFQRDGLVVRGRGPWLLCSVVIHLPDESVAWAQSSPRFECLTSANCNSCVSKQDREFVVVCMIYYLIIQLRSRAVGSTWLP